MKKCIYFLVFGIMSVFAFCDNVVQTELNDVKVYLSGAELTHTAKISLKPGINDILLENIANNISPNSINTYVTGSAIIMSVTEKHDYLNQKEISAEVKKMQDSLDILNYKIAEKNNEL